MLNGQNSCVNKQRGHRAQPLPGSGSLAETNVTNAPSQINEGLTDTPNDKLDYSMKQVCGSQQQGMKRGEPCGRRCVCISDAAAVHMRRCLPHALLDNCPPLNSPSRTLSRQWEWGGALPVPWSSTLSTRAGQRVGCWMGRGGEGAVGARGALQQI